MLYKSKATYPANSRGLKSQLLIEIRNKDCSIGRYSWENFVHYSLNKLKLNRDLYVKIKNWYPNLKWCWLRCIKGFKKKRESEKRRLILDTAFDIAIRPAVGQKVKLIPLKNNCGECFYEHKFFIWRHIMFLSIWLSSFYFMLSRVN